MSEIKHELVIFFIAAGGIIAMGLLGVLAIFANSALLVFAKRGKIAELEAEVEAIKDHMHEKFGERP